MTILLYNWAPSNATHRIGGGVQVYQTNLVKHLLREGIRVIELSSGLEYDLLRRSPRILQATSQKYISLQVINSPIPAPSHSSFDNAGVIGHEDFEEFLMTALTDLGNIDVFHFNSLEGISLGLLRRVSQVFPTSRILYSFHNYHPFCPQVNLWYKERERCHNDYHGRRCINCIDRTAIETVHHRRLSKIIGRGALWKGLRRFFIVAARLRVLLKWKASQRPKTEKQGVSLPKAELFHRRKAEMLEVLNQCVDKFLCVSKRTADIVQSYGIDPKRITLDYIGIDFAEPQQLTKEPHNTEKSLCLGFFGYIRPDKGFDWLMDWIDTLDVKYEEQLSFTISSTTGQHESIHRIQTLSERFQTTYYPGYTHQNLADQLAEVDIGIIPALWEDCLPQVAKEFLHHGVPILSSNRGGAQELVPDDRFVFDPDNPESLTHIIDRILKHDGFLDGYLMKCRQVEVFETYISGYLKYLTEPNVAEKH